MLKIELDKKMTNSIINLYFIMAMWFCMLVMYVQSSNELALVIFLFISLGYFAFSLYLFKLNYDILVLKNKNVIVSRREKLALIFKYIFKYYTLLLIVISSIYFAYSYSEISVLLINIFLGIGFVWLSYLLFTNPKFIKETDKETVLEKEVKVEEPSTKVVKKPSKTTNSKKTTNTKKTTVTKSNAKKTSTTKKSTGPKKSNTSNKNTVTKKKTSTKKKSSTKKTTKK